MSCPSWSYWNVFKFVWGYLEMFSLYDFIQIYSMPAYSNDYTLFSYCDTDVQFSWVRCWWAWWFSIFLRDIQPVYQSACGSLSEICSTMLILLAFWTWGICAYSGQLALQVKSRIGVSRIGVSSTSVDDCFTTRALSRLLDLNIAGCQDDEAQVLLYKTHYKNTILFNQSLIIILQAYLLNYNLKCLFSLMEQWIAVSQKTHEWLLLYHIRLFFFLICKYRSNTLLKRCCQASRE